MPVHQMPVCHQQDIIRHVGSKTGRNHCQRDKKRHVSDGAAVPRVSHSGPICMSGRNALLTDTALPLYGLVGLLNLAELLCRRFLDFRSQCRNLVGVILHGHPAVGALDFVIGGGR